MVVPLSLGLVGKDGRDLPLKVSDRRADQRRRSDPEDAVRNV